MNLLQKYILEYKKNLKKGRIIVISGPSGCGKTTICKELIKRNKNFVFSVSYTTRQKRKGEVNGRDYFFVSEQEFLKMIKQKKLVEWAKVYNNYYGTPKKPLLEAINSGKNILLDIDVQGGKNIKKFFPESILIFILPPSFTVLKQRIISRAKDKLEEIKIRLKNLEKEIKNSKYYDYFVINDNLEETVKNIELIILANKFNKNFLLKINKNKVFKH